MTSIDELLKAHDLERYASIFAENEIDVSSLLLLTESDLAQLVPPLGPRRRLTNAIAELKAARAGGATSGERRQIALLFCDLVDSTALSSEIDDPEILETIIRSYHAACEGIVNRFEGRIYERRGEEVVAFFGHPCAHEDDEIRAIRAGLELIDSIPRLALPHGRSLDVRVTITRGLVIVDADGTRAVGEVETMNLAARLKEIAKRGTVVVSDRVRWLAGGRFDWEDLHEHTFRGISGTIRAWRVCGVRTEPSRFDAATWHGLTPLVGRQREIELVLERYARARTGEGRVVLLAGDAGIGKSRILREVRQELPDKQAAILTFQCSDYYKTSAFYPLLDNLERALKFEPEAAAGARLERLEVWIRERHRPEEDVPLIASLLSIPCDERYGRLQITPQRLKELTIRALVGVVESAAHEAPRLMLFEDAHWADPSSLEALDTLIERIPDLPLLLVISYRPEEFTPRWRDAACCTSLHVSELTRADTLALVANVAGDRTLPAARLEEIIVKTEGLPLFVEEMTKYFLHDLEEQRRSGAAAVTIPDTLHGFLQARLDGVAGPAKEIAQIGSVIGREFSPELIAAVWPMSADSLNDALARLTQSGLALPRQTGTQPIYVFKHALVRDAAYDSLKTKRRQELHGQIADAAEQRFPALCESEPELLAQHYKKAGLNERAVMFYQKAGKVSSNRFALSEAETHLDEGLRLVRTLPEGRARDLSELQLRTQLAPAVVAVHGWAAPKVRAVLEPAWQLADSLGEAESYLPILHGLWVHSLTVGSLAESVRWAERMLTAAATGHEPDLEISAHRALMASYFWLGDLLAAQHHAQVITDAYDAHRHWHIADRTNNDPRTMVGIYASHFLWMLGYPERAMRECDEKDEHARRRNHPFDIGFALTLGSHAYDYCCMPERLLPRAEEAIRIGCDRGVSLMSEIMAQIVIGVAWLRAGRVSDSIGQLRESIGRLHDTGHRIYVTYLRAVLADALARQGDDVGALTLIDESLEQIERQGERVHFAEVLRLKGWMLHRLGHLDAAEEQLHAALAFARSQHAKSWELRVAMALGRLWQSRGRASAAHGLLAPIYDVFTEGHETVDLREAKAFLAELSRSQLEPSGHVRELR